MEKTCKTCGKDFISKHRCLDCSSCRYKANKDICPKCGNPKDRRSKLCIECFRKVQERNPPKEINGELWYWCTRCKRYQPKSDFWKRNKSGRPVLYRCKEWFSKREKARKEDMREYKREWIRKRKERFFADKSCEKCGKTNNLMVLANHGKKIRDIRPWNNDSPRHLYTILCQRDAKASIAARISEMWANGVYDGLFGELNPIISHAYPFIENWDDYNSLPASGKELTVKVHEIVPKGISEQIRRDICQDIIVSILSEDHVIEDFDDIQLLNKFISVGYKLAPSRFMYSLDHPLPWMHEGDRNLIDMLHEDELRHVV